MIGIRYYGCSWRGGAVGPVTVNNLHVFIFRSHPMMSSFSSPRTRASSGTRAIWCSVHLNMSLSANALLATIAAIGAADVSYCMLSHPGSFLSSAVRGFAFSRLLLHAQGSFS